MKQQSKFSGIVLLGTGLFFLANQMNISVLKPYLIWPTLLAILGIAFLIQSSQAKDGSSAFSGVLLLGLGIHFYAITKISNWPQSLGMITFIIGLSFLYQYKKSKDGLFPGIILLAISSWILFFKTNTPPIKNLFSSVEGFWPFALIAVGIYFMFLKKK